MAGLADELGQPIAVGDLAAVGFPVLQNVDPPYPSVRLQRHRVVDDEVLADHIVDNKIAEEAIAGLRLPHLLAAGLHLLARQLLDRGDV